MTTTLLTIYLTGMTTTGLVMAVRDEGYDPLEPWDYFAVVVLWFWFVPAMFALALRDDIRFARWNAQLDRLTRPDPDKWAEGPESRPEVADTGL